MKMILPLLILLFNLPWARAVEISAGLGTEFPIGLHADVVMNQESFFARGRYAKFLQPYTDAMNSISESADFYTSATGELISEALHNADFLEIALGYAIDPNSGWRFELSYGIAKGSGQTNGSTIAEAVAGISLPNGGNAYDIEGEIQTIGLRVGDRLSLGDAQVLDISVGVLRPIDSETSIDRATAGPIQEALLQAANRSVDQYIKDKMKNEVFIPVLAATWIYQF